MSTVGELADEMTGGNEAMMRRLLREAGLDVDELVSNRDETLSEDAVMAAATLRWGTDRGEVLGGAEPSELEESEAFLRKLWRACLKKLEVPSEDDERWEEVEAWRRFDQAVAAVDATAETQAEIDVKIDALTSGEDIDYLQELWASEDCSPWRVTRSYALEQWEALLRADNMGENYDWGALLKAIDLVAETFPGVRLALAVEIAGAARALPRDHEGRRRLLEKARQLRSIGSTDDLPNRGSA